MGYSKFASDALKITISILVVIAIMGYINKNILKSVKIQNKTTIDSLNNSILRYKQNILLYNDSLKFLNEKLINVESVISVDSIKVDSLITSLDSIKNYLSNTTIVEDSSILAEYLKSPIQIDGKYIKITRMQSKSIEYCIIKSDINDSIILKQGRIITNLHTKISLLSSKVIMLETVNSIEGNKTKLYEQKLRVEDKFHKKEVRILKRKLFFRTITGIATTTGAILLVLMRR